MTFFIDSAHATGARRNHQIDHTELQWASLDERSRGYKAIRLGELVHDVTYYADTPVLQDLNLFGLIGSSDFTEEG